MLIFGTYTLCLQTLDSRFVPFASQLGAGAVIQQRVRVFHLFFIPVFPLSRYWCMKVNGEQYALDYRAETLLRQAGAEEKGMPWYSFSALLLLALGFIGLQFGLI